MKQQTYTLEFLTPCFCAGADQAVAEIRAPAIRGQLRWWFRALGGSSADEREIFGGVAGTANASALTVRVSNFNKIGVWSPPPVSQNSPDSYVWHFASVSGKAPGSGAKSTGPRWTSSGAIAPKSTFRIALIQRRPLAPGQQQRLDEAIRCFLQLGALGLRITRGLGAFACQEEPFTPAALDPLSTRGFTHELRNGTFATVDAMTLEIGRLVKGTRKANGWTISDKQKLSTPSPLGASSERQTSAVYFRPVRLKGETDLLLVVFQAPDERVLDRPSRKGDAISRLAYPPPVAQRNGRF
jgi:CRISPR type III-B/RAMP module RAMP protein Cmr1